MTCCLSSLISLDLVSRVSNYAASRRDGSVLRFLFDVTAATCIHLRVMST